MENQLFQKKMKSPRGKRIKRKAGFTVLRIFLLSILILLAVGAVIGFTVLRQIIADAPDISNVALSPTEAATYIYNQEGQRVQKLTLPGSQPGPGDPGPYSRRSAACGSGH